MIVQNSVKHWFSSTMQTSYEGQFSPSFSQMSFFVLQNMFWVTTLHLILMRLTPHQYVPTH